MALSDLFKSKEPLAAELQAALETIDVTSLDAEISAATSARQAALIDGTDREVADAEKRLADAHLAADRGRARHAELNRRLDEARTREAREAVLAEHAAVSKRADEFATRFARDYVKLAGSLVALLVELNEVETAAKTANEAADKVGLLAETGGRIRQIEARVFPFGPAGQFDSMLLHTRLRQLRTAQGHLDPTKPNWPPEKFSCVWE